MKDTPFSTYRFIWVGNEPQHTHIGLNYLNLEQLNPQNGTTPGFIAVKVVSK